MHKTECISSHLNAIYIRSSKVLLILMFISYIYLWPGIFSLKYERCLITLLLRGGNLCFYTMEMKSSFDILDINCVLGFLCKVIIKHSLFLLVRRISRNIQRQFNTGNANYIFWQHAKNVLNKKYLLCLLLLLWCYYDSFSNECVSN